MVNAVRAGLKKNGRYIAFIVLLIAIVGLIVWVLKIHNRPAAQTPSQFSLPNSQIIAGQKQAAASALAAKDYQAAADSYLAEAAAVGQEPAKALAILKEASQKIPEQYLPWYFYDSYAGVAKQAKAVSVEKDSLQKALIKAQAPNSGAPPSVIDIYNQRLKVLAGQ